MRILVTGATNQIGQFLLPKLHRHICQAVSRQPQTQAANIYWQQADLTQPSPALWQTPPCQAWIHLGFLNLATPHLAAAAHAGVKHFIGISSTSIFTKNSTQSPFERNQITQLIKAETYLQKNAPAYNMTVTLLRPTLIYGAGRDHNITIIQRFIQKFGFFPLAGAACGLRQPVHAEDIASACLAALHAPQRGCRAYQLAGAEQLSYRQMVERLFAVQNRPTRLLHLPPALYKTGLRLLALTQPRYAFVQPDMADRMNQDMIFDITLAQRDLGFQPRPFRPPPLHIP
jgi:nucleoside-diphosphate-sugar epimerase